MKRHLKKMFAFLKKNAGCLWGSLFFYSLCCCLALILQNLQDDHTLKLQQAALLAQKEAIQPQNANKLHNSITVSPHDEAYALTGAGVETALAQLALPAFQEPDSGTLRSGSPVPNGPAMLPEYEVLYEINNDLIGWLSVPGTVIDYPVMQTPKDENAYPYLDFNQQPNRNGSLIMDTDSLVGIGSAENQYEDGTAPSTNLIIHGHTMKSGQMFGDLNLFQEETYWKEHSLICFDSLYEKREYEVMVAFYSQVYYENDEAFKYYQFFQADTREEFTDWYLNIKKKALYDTGVTASYGDEFITLSCCSYHVDDGRFVVVGKRVK